MFHKLANTELVHIILIPTFKNVHIFEGEIDIPFKDTIIYKVLTCIFTGYLMDSRNHSVF